MNPILYISFESFNAYMLYHYIQNVLHVQITPVHGMHFTELHLYGILLRISEPD